MKFEDWLAKQRKKKYLKLGPPRISMKAAYKAGYRDGFKVGLLSSMVEGKKIDFNSKD